jgi:hypothetical protein
LISIINILNIKNDTFILIINVVKIMEIIDVNLEKQSSPSEMRKLYQAIEVIDPYLKNQISGRKFMIRHLIDIILQV